MLAKNDFSGKFSKYTDSFQEQYGQSIV
jgi:hypothetical protein